MIAVLFALPDVKTGSLYMPIRQRANPYIRPGRRNSKFFNSFYLIFSLQWFIVIDVSKPFPFFILDIPLNPTLRKQAQQLRLPFHSHGRCEEILYETIQLPLDPFAFPLLFIIILDLSTKKARRDGLTFNP